MRASLDPEGVELPQLFAAADFAQMRVLEVGCGHGRLARRYAAKPRMIVGVDSDRAELLAALSLPAESAAARLRFVQAKASILPVQSERFDIVIFGWSF
jgi:ubiquinone/menaquinone biosynthesis C-methylase UbiE